MGSGLPTVATTPEAGASMVAWLPLAVDDFRKSAAARSALASLLEPSEAVGKSRLRKAALRSQRCMSERLGATASGQTDIPRRMRWPISEPTLDMERDLAVHHAGTSHSWGVGRPPGGPVPAHLCAGCRRIYIDARTAPATPTRSIGSRSDPAGSPGVFPTASSTSSTATVRSSWSSVALARGALAETLAFVGGRACTCGV